MAQQLGSSVTRYSVALSFTTQYEMPQEFGTKLGMVPMKTLVIRMECLNTNFPGSLHLSSPNDLLYILASHK